MTGSDSQSGPARVAVVGGGLAGLAAAVALAERGLRVELFEAGRRLGGRAGSFRDSVSGEMLDGCQHAAMGCCTNLLDFCRRTGSADCFRHTGRLHFIAPNARRYEFSALPGLPAPLHLLPGLMRLGYLTLGERLRIMRTMGRLAKLSAEGPSEDMTIGAWLRSQGESDRALDRFWSVVLTSALSETLERASLAAARKVFVDGFLAARRAYELVVPEVTLDEIFDRRASDWLGSRGVIIHRRVRIRRIEGDARRARAIVLPDGSQRPFDFFVVAVPWRAVGRLFSPAMLAALSALEQAERIPSAPITAVHLWFDRPVTRLREAALVGRLSQWIFSGPEDRTRAARDGAKAETPASGYYCQVVISASHGLIGRRGRDVADKVTQELGAIWPAARQARLVRSRVVTHRQAVFSVQPGIDRLRAPQQTAVENLALAGDWTATGWPATMEGAVRSGYLAAEAILRQQGQGADPRVLQADLPRGLLARRMLGAEPSLRPGST
jgi:squalene-associated FAD-dependent desaturase